MVAGVRPVSGGANDAKRRTRKRSGALTAVSDSFLYGAFLGDRQQSRAAGSADSHQPSLRRKKKNERKIFCLRGSTGCWSVSGSKTGEARAADTGLLTLGYLQTKNSIDWSIR